MLTPSVVELFAVNCLNDPDISAKLSSCEQPLPQLLLFSANRRISKTEMLRSLDAQCERCERELDVSIKWPGGHGLPPSA